MDAKHMSSQALLEDYLLAFNTPERSKELREALYNRGFEDRHFEALRERMALLIENYLCYK